jgi:hypothetical protein
MKRKILILVLASVPILAGIGVTYDPNSPGVANRVIRIVPSVDTTTFAAQPNSVVFVSWSDVFTNNASDLKWNGSAVVVLTQSERDAIASAQAAIVLANAQFQERIAKTNALATINKLDLDGRVLTAFAEIVKDEINILRSQMNLDRTNETAFRSATNRNTVPLGDRTMLQLKNAISAKISEQADNN